MACKTDSIVCKRNLIELNICLFFLILLLYHRFHNRCSSKPIISNHIYYMSLYCNVFMYCIASSIMSSCESFPDCCRSGNIFFSFSMSAWLMLDVSSSTSPIFTPMMVVIAVDVLHSTDSGRLTIILSSTVHNSLVVPPIRWLGVDCPESD